MPISSRPRPPAKTIAYFGSYLGLLLFWSIGAVGHSRSYAGRRLNRLLGTHRSSFYPESTARNRIARELRVELDVLLIA